MLILTGSLENEEPVLPIYRGLHPSPDSAQVAICSKSLANAETGDRWELFILQFKPAQIQPLRALDACP